MDGMAGQLDADLLRAYAPVILRAGGDDRAATEGSAGLEQTIP